MLGVRLGDQPGVTPGRADPVTLPPLYDEGLRQHSRQGFLELCVYKLGLIEAILKDSIRRIDSDDAEVVKAKLRDAVAVAQWELRPPRRSSD
jgi:hypothetical protein